MNEWMGLEKGVIELRYMVYVGEKGLGMGEWWIVNGWMVNDLGNVPFVNRSSMLPTFSAHAPGSGVAGAKRPCWLGSSNSRPPTESWKRRVKELSGRFVS